MPNTGNVAAGFRKITTWADRKKLKEIAGRDAGPEGAV